MTQNNDEEKLLGDLTEEMLEKIGADKLAKAYEEITDHDCGCDKRKEWLNEFHLRWKSLWKSLWEKDKP